ncbi:MAG: 4'-phosphopantetheinyl transferase family protein [Blastocatellia bacterium]
MFIREDTQTIWQSPPAELSLPRDEVHVWRARLDQPQRLAEFSATLAPDEQARAARYHFQKDRDHFIAARGLLRLLLSRYLQINPANFSFCYSAFGKPSLASHHGADLCFNISHSHDLALLAFAQGRELGIDLEWIRPEVAGEQIAEHFFSRGEVATLRALPERRQTEAFFNCWTRKEAYIKARGEGLSLPLNQFDVSLAPGEPAALLRAAMSDETARWMMLDLTVGAGYKAALVVEGRGWRLRCLQWLDG